MRELVNQKKLISFALYINLKKKLLMLFIFASLFQIQANASDYATKIVLKSDAGSEVNSIVSGAQFQISGSVVDRNGQPLPGANVIEKGTSNGTVTDFDGLFSLRLSNQNATIVVSYLGFVTKEIQVKGQAQMTIELQDNLSELDEVVVVGYGSQKKESVVGSITQAKGEEILRAGSVATVSEALAGIMPGVSTLQAAGQPGSTGADILIRGRSTFGGSGNNDPLFIVDGVERAFDDIDPNDIESISVLKDASATAVFGVKAANGVIVVTTKRGKSGETKVNFSSSWGLKEPTMNTDYFADYATTLERFNEAAMNDRLYSLLKPQSLIDTWRDPNRDKTYYTYTTWIKELLKTGTTSQYNVNASGGNDFVSYYTSLGYQYDGDIFDIQKQKDFDPRTYQKKYNWRSNLDFNFSKSTKFNVGLAGNFITVNKNVITQGTNDGIASGSGDSFTRMFQTPLIGAIPILPDGSLTTTEGASVNPNFYRMEKEGQWKTRSNSMFSDFTLVQNINKNFKVSGKLAYNYFQEYDSKIQQTGLNYYYYNQDKTGFIQAGDPNAVTPPLTVTGESISGSNNSLYYEFRGNFDNSYGDHEVGAMAQFSRRKFQGGVDFPRYEESWVARATYAYQSKYLAEFNGAYNGNENWAPGLRFGFFPSAAVGWVVTKEKFFKENFKFFDFLKFRYSYGEIGSDKGIGSNRFLYRSSYDARSGGTASLYFGEPGIDYGFLYLEGRPAVVDNTWETSIKQDLAMEFGVLNNRLKGTIELFKEDRKDILIQRNTIAPWYGNLKPFANIGAIKNHGIDIEIKYDSDKSKDFQYFFRGNMSLSESRIVNQDDAPSTAAHQVNAGKPVGWQSGLLDDGLYQSWDDLYNSTPSGFTAASSLIPGSVSFVDYNGDGVIDLQDRVAINNPNFATKTYAFSVGVSYKNFSVHALFNGMFDISKQLADEYLFEHASASTDAWQLVNNEQLDAWSFDNPNGTHPALRVSSNNHDNQLSTYTHRSSDFLRFKTCELKYKLGKQLIKAIGLFDTFEVYMNGNNLATWSDLPDEFDPEAAQLLVYPITKRYNFGVRASF